MLLDEGADKRDEKECHGCKHRVGGCGSKTRHQSGIAILAQRALDAKHSHGAECYGCYEADNQASNKEFKSHCDVLRRK